MKKKKKSCEACGRGGAPATTKRKWDGRLLTRRASILVEARGIVDMDALLSMDIRSFVTGGSWVKPKVLNELILKAYETANHKNR